MSADVLSIIPTDPYWNPDQDAGARAPAIVTELSYGTPGGVAIEIDATWHGMLSVVGCGENLERIGCPHCGGSINIEWWGDQLEAHCEDGFTTLAGPADSPASRSPPGIPNSSCLRTRSSQGSQMRSGTPSARSGLTSDLHPPSARRMPDAGCRTNVAGPAPRDQARIGSPLHT